MIRQNRTNTAKPPAGTHSRQNTTNYKNVFFWTFLGHKKRKNPI
jgi:hypothetical protein